MEEEKGIKIGGWESWSEARRDAVDRQNWRRSVMALCARRHEWFYVPGSTKRIVGLQGISLSCKYTECMPA